MPETERARDQACCVGPEEITTDTEIHDTTERARDQACCADPGVVEEWEIDAYMDGEAEAQVAACVAAHLERCPACRARLEANLALERRLQGALYRLDCPSLDLLRDYAWGYLAADQQGQVREHLAWCPHCAKELSELKGGMAVERAAPPDSLLARAQQLADQVRLVIARLVSPDLRLAPALRGEVGEVLLFEAEDVALSVHLEREEAGAYTLFGQVLAGWAAGPAELASLSAPVPGGGFREGEGRPRGRGLGAWEGREGTELTLLSAPVPGGGFQEGSVRLMGSGTTGEKKRGILILATVDAHGGFAIPGLPPGDYQLALSLPGRRIVVPSLALEMGS